MADKNEAHLLVALQDLEEMIREAEDPAQRAKLESSTQTSRNPESLRQSWFPVPPMSWISRSRKIR